MWELMVPACNIGEHDHVRNIDINKVGNSILGENSKYIKCKS